MGLFKQMGQMKGMIQDAPEQIRGAQAMAAQAQEMAAAQQAAAQAQMAQMQQQTAAPAAGVAGAADLTPIAGVSLELYAQVSKELASVGYDQSQAAALAAGKGISAESWDQALNGWNARIQANRAIGQQFNALYMGS